MSKMLSKKDKEKHDGKIERCIAFILRQDYDKFKVWQIIRPQQLTSIEIYQALRHEHRLPKILKSVCGTFFGANIWKNRKN